MIRHKAVSFLETHDKLDLYTNDHEVVALGNIKVSLILWKRFGSKGKFSTIMIT